MIRVLLARTYRHCHLAGLAVLAILLCGAETGIAKAVQCPDGNHFLIDVKEITIRYQATGIETTLNGLAVLRVAVNPKTLQQAAIGTQKMNEVLKAMVVGYNSCAMTQQQYNECMKLLFQDIKGDAIKLEELRKEVLAGKKIDAKRQEDYEKHLKRYEGKLQKLYQISGKEVDYESITSIVEEIVHKQIEGIRSEQVQVNEDILKRLASLEQKQAERQPTAPSHVSVELSETKKQMLQEVEVAEEAYKKGYALMDRYRFAEAVPYFQHALSKVKLPDFYYALALAYEELPDLNKAEKTIIEGLDVATNKIDPAKKASYDNLLGQILQAKGDLDGALKYTERALKSDEKVYGLDHPKVAIDANNIGTILQAKGDLDGALKYTERALKIDERVFGHPNEAIRANNIGQILQAKGDLDGALKYTERALKSDEKVYGLDHPKVAIDANNIGTILQAKGDLDGALKYTERALKIDEKVYGLDHPNVAIRSNNIGQIMKAKGDLDGALKYTERALKIDEKVYGLDHPKVAIRSNNIGTIIKAKGDLDGALKYTERALKIDEKFYGLDHPKVAIHSNNIGTILKAKGDLDGALKYAERAYKILLKCYGPDDPLTKTIARNLGVIRNARK
ncbi:MAG: tetratricopeptide repeat protein [Smithella sp.]|jgi:tetratricopeptide (TPR) repeat protein